MLGWAHAHEGAEEHHEETEGRDCEVRVAGRNAQLDVLDIHAVHRDDEARDEEDDADSEFEGPHQVSTHDLECGRSAFHHEVTMRCSRRPMAAEAPIMITQVMRSRLRSLIQIQPPITGRAPIWMTFTRKSTNSAPPAMAASP